MFDKHKNKLSNCEKIIKLIGGNIKIIFGAEGTQYILYFYSRTQPQTTEFVKNNIKNI